MCINWYVGEIMRVVPKKKEILILPFLIPHLQRWCCRWGIFCVTPYFIKGTEKVRSAVAELAFSAS